MPTYVFKGRNRLNEMIAGEREAATQEELRALLRREQVVLTAGAFLNPGESVVPVRPKSN